MIQKLHIMTKFRTHMAFHQQVRTPLLEKWMLIARDHSISLFWYITVLHHVTVSNLLQSVHQCYE